MRRAALAAFMGAALVQAQAPIRGFVREEWAARHALEKRLRESADAKRVREALVRMAAAPHPAGSPASKAVAEYALARFREWGLEARIEVFEALLPYPTATVVEMTAPVKFRARMKEPRIAEDPDSRASALPPYHAYAASGDVRGPLVYVNYGLQPDYAELKRLGVDVKGKVVIARYGGSWRGTKVKLAQEHGALACLVYSDPRDDGYFQGDAYPRGPYRPAESVQRGSVMDMPLYVGDPLTPGWASEAGSKRLPLAEARTVMKIPSLPLSYADAQPLLAQLGGPVAPEAWRGALPLTYHVGPGPATVRVRTGFDWSVKPVYNVIARLPGAVWPDEWVLYGNHHDAWVIGASDPVSGAASLMESARALAELRRGGWQPKRSIVFALWDAEEFGLVGSTEWVEKHRAELEAKAVAYLNSDSNTGGEFGADGSPALETFFREVLRDNVDPASKTPLLEWMERPGRAGRKPGPFRLGPLGAGSDYVAFVHHAGIASLNFGFSRAGASGTYHSIYDSSRWFLTHMDPELAYGRALAQVTGTALMRLADAAVLPWDFRPVESAVRQWVTDLAQHRELDLSGVRRELDGLKRAADEYEAALEAAQSRGSGWDPARLGAVNRALAEAERRLTLEAGLEGRSWYRHQLFAPGLYAGYGARTLPGVREPAEAGRMEQACRQTPALEETLRRLREHVEAAGRLLGGR